MSRYYIVNESTEDSFEPANQLEDAIRMAREVAGQGNAGELISILEGGGLAVRQFVQMPDGTVTEQHIVQPTNYAGAAKTGLNSSGT